jgi:hypothetical protein
MGAIRELEDLEKVLCVAGQPEAAQSIQEVREFLNYPFEREEPFEPRSIEEAFDIFAEAIKSGGMAALLEKCPESLRPQDGEDVHQFLEGLQGYISENPDYGETSLLPKNLEFVTKKYEEIKRSQIPYGERFFGGAIGKACGR